MGSNMDVIKLKKIINTLDFSRIIAVTNRKLCINPFPEQIEHICQLHPKAIILREKDLTSAEYSALTDQILPICQKYQVPCILHSFIEVATQKQTDSIHLPLWKFKENASYIRKTFFTIGVSTHSLKEALEAQSLGATYVTAGHIYSTDCKKDLAPRGLDFLKQICDTVQIPVYGIGGINLNPTKIQEILTQGTAGACVMSALMSHTF